MIEASDSQLRTTVAQIVNCKFDLFGRGITTSLEKILKVKLLIVTHDSLKTFVITYNRLGLNYEESSLRLFDLYAF